MKIEKGVDVPSERKRLSYPYAQMDVGDSFFIKDVALQTICNANYRYGSKHGVKFTARKQDGGIRVWRID